MVFRGTRSRGGKRQNAGRKPKAYTEFKRRLEAERIEDADYAFWLHAQTMRDEETPLDLRLSCADWVANRVLGSPKTRNETEQSGKLTIEIVRENPNQATAITPEPTAHQK